MMKHALYLILLSLVTFSSAHAADIKDLCEARAFADINQIAAQRKQPLATIIYGATPPVIDGLSYTVEDAQIRGPRYKATLKYTCIVNPDHTAVTSFISHMKSIR